MSKSKGNVVVPDKYLNELGADALRMYLMFLGPYQEGGDWRDSGIMGVVRFLNRTWDHFNKVKVDNKKPLSPWMNPAIKKVAEDIENLKYNTAISELMVVLRRFEDEKINGKKDLEAFLLLLAPFGVFISEELWEKLGHSSSIHVALWPTYSEGALKSDTVNLVLQVNGKLRGMIAIKRGITEAQVKELALKEPKVIAALSGKKPKKVIYVQDKIINLVG